MALFQLFAGVLVAFMGIVIFGVFFAQWSDPASPSSVGRTTPLEQFLEADRLAKRALLRAVYGEGAGDDDRFEPPSLESAPPTEKNMHPIDDLLKVNQSLTTVNGALARSPDILEKTNWSGVVRAVGILFFIEAVAWFLLQQYRRSMEDYKEFQRRAMKRGNLKVAHTMLQARELMPDERLVLTALLTEDMTGRLQQGETTDALEASKIVDPNPLFALFRDILAVVIGSGDKSTDKKAG